MHENEGEAVVSQQDGEFSRAALLGYTETEAGLEKTGELGMQQICAPLAAPHPVVEIENVKLDLVVDSILGSAGHMQHSQDAAWVTTA